MDDHPKRGPIWRVQILASALREEQKHPATLLLSMQGQSLFGTRIPMSTAGSYQSACLP
jgi:hypothetical protein